MRTVWGWMRRVAAAGMLAGVGAAAMAQAQAPVQAAKVDAAAAAPAKAAAAVDPLLAQMDELLKMAAELKVSVDKTTKDQMSLDVIRKAEELEKKAKRVKEQVRAGR